MLEIINDKEKQIEEMAKELKELAKIIRVVLENRTDIKYIPDLDFPIAKEILKHYQQKLPENSVVLSKEEYEDLRLLEEKYGKPTYIDGCMTAYAHRLETANNLVSKASKETVKKIIAFIETLRVPEDDRHEWRDRHNDTIDRVILKLNQKFINGTEIKEEKND